MKQQENKKCGDESCKCASEKDSQTQISNLTAVSNISKNEKDDKVLDPTHFGDWQVNCRTIDF